MTLSWLRRIAFTSLFLAAALAGAAEQTSGLDAALQQLHDDIRSATARRDRAALEKLFADEYLFVHTTGGAEAKEAYITRLLTTQPGMSGGVPKQQEVHQHAYGKDDVVVRTALVVAPNNSIWWTYVYVKRDGRWQLARQHGTAVPEQRPTVSIDPATLQRYVGKYVLESGAVVTIRAEGATLIAQSPGRPEVTLLPEAEDRFHLKDGATLYTFARDDKGEVTEVTVKRATGAEVTARKQRE